MCNLCKIYVANTTMIALQKYCDILFQKSILKLLQKINNDNDDATFSMVLLQNNNKTMIVEGMMKTLT